MTNQTKCNKITYYVIKNSNMKEIFPLNVQLVCYQNQGMEINIRIKQRKKIVIP